MNKLDTQEHAIQLMIEALSNAVDNADSEIEVKVYTAEINKLTRRYHAVAAKRSA